MSLIVIALAVLAVAASGFGIFLQFEGERRIGGLMIDHVSAYLAALGLAVLDVAILAIVGGVHVFG